MPRQHHRPLLAPTPARAVTAAVAAGVAGLVAVALLVLPSSTAGTAGAASGRGTATVASAGTTAASVARSTNPATPGDFTGFGFDQCLAPSQAAMNAWLQHSPFLAVGIYISGNSRHCRHQPHLTPTWVAHQLARGWRLLPITLGPQSSCVGRYPKYGPTIDPTIRTSSTGGYAAARAQGVAEADSAVGAASGLGIVPGSTLWYDLEGWSDYRNATCREAALSFLTGWTQRVRQHGYVSGVYSSAGSGLKILDDARFQGRTDVTLPDRIWIARWDNVANTSTSYLREDGWRPGGRMKQYQGGHDETWGGVTINIDRNYLDLGAGSRSAAPESHCNGLPVDLPAYGFLKRGTERFTPDPAQVKALKCLLKERGTYAGRVNRFYSRRLVTAVRAWRAAHGLPVRGDWTRAAWASLFAAGPKPVVKIGSTGPAVRDLQRALRAIYPRVRLPNDGVFTAQTAQALRGFQKARGLRTNGNGNTQTWTALATRPFG
jgi:hypothetical protein